MELLEVRDLSVSFGGVRALDGVSFSAPQGQVTALIGPNGAGKTTVLNCISGLVRPQAGQARLLGREVLGRGGHHLANLGLGRTFQGLQVFGRMTVLENIMVGMHASLKSEFMISMLRLPGFRREEALARERALAVLDFVGLADRARDKAGDMSYGEQKRLDLARALAGEPKLLLLDEPVAGLNPAESDQVGELLERLRGQGVGLVLIEHDMGLLMKISQHVVVLDCGVKIAEGTPHQVQNDPQVIQVYLGGGEEFGLCA